MGHGPNWTPEEIATAEALRAQGKSDMHIAGVLGRPVTGVTALFYRLACAAGEGSPAPTMRWRRWTEAERARAQDMRAHGHSMMAIAQALDRTRKAVELMFYYQGRPRPRASRSGQDQAAGPAIPAPSYRPPRVLGRWPDWAVFEDIDDPDCDKDTGRPPPAFPETIAPVRRGPQRAEP